MPQTSYPLDNALYLWEEGGRRLRSLNADPRRGFAATRAVAAIDDELRRRLGPTFTAAQLASLYGAGTDWCLEAARRALPLEAADLDPEAIVDGAFYEHLRAATDWAGGRLILDEA